jgi:hypothetical protein
LSDFAKWSHPEKDEGDRTLPSILSDDFGSRERTNNHIQHADGQGKLVFDSTLARENEFSTRMPMPTTFARSNAEEENFMEPPERRPDRLSLYDRLGGWVFINLTVEKLCERLQADPKLTDLLAPYEPEVMQHTIAGLAVDVLGNGKVAIPNLEDQDNHVKTLTSSQFNRGISHLIAALVWTGVSRELIEVVLDRVSPLEEQLVRPADPKPGTR